MSRVRAALAGVPILVFAVARCASPGPGDAARSTNEPEVTYVGRAACVACHEREHEAWRSSHHDLAMQVADAGSVLGDFDGATLEDSGVTTTFQRRDGKFVVTTEGPDGRSADYEVAYTFGVEPLQQYLVGFPGGRFQTLRASWDSRPADQGGQRWFNQYPGELIPHDDALHWTGPNQNWNYMCAECHSTDLRRNYDLAGNSYRTTWSEIDVSCEACHGPASGHVAWAAHAEPGQPSQGLLFSLQRGAVRWEMDPQSGIAHRVPPLAGDREVETCAPCHSRRAVVGESLNRGKAYGDSYRPALLEQRLYHADGQIDEEVYVYGSFLQSKMHRAGVTCSDCHDPHRLDLHSSADGLCAGCHLPARFDTPEHHHHAADSTGSSCVACHMPEKTYMVVDPRRDHSFRVPRPDLTLKIGAPNACTGCHADRDPGWAAETAAAWYGPRAPHYGEALDAGRKRLAGAHAALEDLVADPDTTGIVRATAVSLLAGLGRPESLPVFELALADDDPLVRGEALRATETLPPSERVRLAFSLLDDPLRSVRVRAARALAAVPSDALGPGQGAAIERGLDEFRASQMALAERAEAHLTLGAMEIERGDLERARGDYETALRLDPGFVEAWINLADLERLRHDDKAGASHLQRALEIAPDNGDVHHALGLLLVRLRSLDEARRELELAVELSPHEPRYAFVLAVALTDLGRPDDALAVLEAAHLRHPTDRDVLATLATLHRDRGGIDVALGYARKLAALTPDDPAVRRFVSGLESEQR